MLGARLVTHHNLFFYGALCRAAREAIRQGRYSAFASDAAARMRDGDEVKTGARSEYNVGAWLIGNGTLGYALSSAPRRDDVGFLKFKALTSGADAAASRVVKSNIEGMARWAAKR